MSEIGKRLKKHTDEHEIQLTVSPAGVAEGGGSEVEVGGGGR